MAFNPKEMQVMASSVGGGFPLGDQPGAPSRDGQWAMHIWFYANTAADDVSVADFFLPYFMVTDLPIHERQKTIGAHNDLLYDGYNGILYKLGFDNVDNPTTVTTVSLVGAATVPPPLPTP